MQDQLARKRVRCRLISHTDDLGKVNRQSPRKQPGDHPTKEAPQSKARFDSVGDVRRQKHCPNHDRRRQSADKIQNQESWKFGIESNHPLAR